MSDHWHHASEIQGAADDRHGHPDLERDISSVESDLRGHRHYDLETDDKTAQQAITCLRAELNELREDLRDALERLRALEDRQPDYADATDDEPEEEPPVAEYDPGPECDDEGGMSEYRYVLPEDYERGQS
jgi:hypothetical protein